jgi:acyl dehydratase
MHDAVADELTAIRRAEVVVEPDWAASFAAAVGADDRRLVAPDTVAEQWVHPVFAAAVEWPLTELRPPGFADLDDETVHRALHATHAIEITAALSAGETVHVAARTSRVRQTRTGMAVTARFDTTGADSSPRFTSWMTLVYRDVEAADFGDDPGPPAPKPTEHRGEAAGVRHVERGAAHVYTACSKIANPIHTDVDTARRAALPGPVAHGTQTLACLVTSALAFMPDRDPRHIASISARFVAPVLPPATVQHFVACLDGGLRATALVDDLVVCVAEIGVHR